MSTKKDNYPGLKFSAKQLSAYYVHDTYCILSIRQEDRTIVFTPDDIKEFTAWLKAHKIREVKLKDL